MQATQNTYKALSFELKQNGDICDLMPVEKEFRLEDVHMLDANLFIIKSTNPQIILSNVLVNNQKEQIRETLWIDKQTTDAVRNHLIGEDTNISRPRSRVENIKSVETFMNVELDTSRLFIRQNINGEKKRVYWEELSELDAYVQLKRIEQSKPWTSHVSSYPTC